ncbi:MAG: hypothetical protein ABIY51_01910 [Ferruginibacter sp.]
MSVTNTIPTSSHFISLSKAVEMTTAYRADKETILATTYQNQDILANSETFNRAALDTLLAIEGCAGIRLYNGMDENLKVHAILVGVNENNEDILPTSSLIENEEDEYIAEDGQRCPPLCPPASDLNE